MRESAVGAAAPAIGMMALATYLPEQMQTSAWLAEQIGIPEAVVREKLGIHAKRRAGYADQTSADGRACRPHRARARGRGARRARSHPLLRQHAQRLLRLVRRQPHPVPARRTNAWAFELVALCTTNVLALKVARDLMTADARLRTVLICGGHRTADLIDFRDQSARFLFNLCDGGSAMVLRRGHPGNQVLDSSFITDGSLSEDVVIPPGGTRMPTCTRRWRGATHLPRRRHRAPQGRPGRHLGAEFRARGARGRRASGPRSPISLSWPSTT